MWGKLVALCVVICAVVSPALGERNNEITTDSKLTMGKSGVVCTKTGRRCIFNATCEANRCKCLDGERGQAQIECVDKRERLCYISGDPHIVSFSNSQALISLPCRFRAARFVTDYKGALSFPHGHCAIEVFATSQLLRGRYAVRSVHISVGITDSVKGVHTNAEIYKTADFDVNDTAIYKYQTRTTHRDSIWGSTATAADGLNIHPDFDEVNNFATLDLPDCSSRIKYRAFNPRTPRHQRQLPGVTIMTHRNAYFHEDKGDYPTAACGTPDDTRLLYRDRANVLGAIDANYALLFDMLADAADQMDNSGMAGRCNLAFNIFANSSTQLDDVNVCGFIMIKFRVGMCIEDAGFFPIDIFNSCMWRRQNAGRGCGRYRRAAQACDSLSDWTGPKQADITCPFAVEATTPVVGPKDFI